MTSNPLEVYNTFFRNSVGFSDLFGNIRHKASSYPPTNIAILQNSTGAEGKRYEITLAVAGFTMDDIEIVHEGNSLRVTGNSSVLDDTADRQYLYRGIAARGFTRTFILADHLEVERAALVDGMLTVTLLELIPEQLQPKRIAIQAS